MLCPPEVPEGGTVVKVHEAEEVAKYFISSSPVQLMLVLMLFLCQYIFRLFRSSAGIDFYPPMLSILKSSLTLQGFRITKRHVCISAIHYSHIAEEP